MNKEEKEEKFALKMVSIIIFGILSFTLIIGLFWGREGIANFFIGTGLMLLGIFFIYITSAD